MDVSEINQLIAGHFEEQVEFNQYLHPADADNDADFLADAKNDADKDADFLTDAKNDADFLTDADKDADFPGLYDLVNEVIGGDVNNLDAFKDTVLGGIPQSGGEVQGPTPLDEANMDEANIPALNQPLNNGMLQDASAMPAVTPVVLLGVDGQFVLSSPLQLQMPQQNGVYQGVQLITLPAQNTVTAVSPSPAAVKQQNDDLTALTAVTSPTAQISQSVSNKRKEIDDSEGKSCKKTKLYEATAFSDPVMEKKRLNAINAKNHRDRTKQTIQELEVKVANITQDRDALAREVEKINQEKDDERNAYIKEIQDLRKINEELKKKLRNVILLQEQFVQQQQKCGIQESNLADLLH